MHRLILAGSPRSDGRTAALADELFNACIEECPEDGVSIVAVSSVNVGGCIGCDACREEGAAPEPMKDGDPLSPCALVAKSDAALHQCILKDDMPEVRKHLDAADELVVVCPVYFAGAPSQFKALLDRLQPYFWSNLRRGELRPAVLHVVGEGSDPYGFEALIQSLSSALLVAGFQLELVLDWVGKITPEGEITAEADEYPIPPVGGCAALGWDGDDEWVVLETEEEPTEGEVVVEEPPAPAPVSAPAPAKAERPQKSSQAKKKDGRAQLSLGKAGGKGGKKKPGSGRGNKGRSGQGQGRNQGQSRGKGRPRG